MGTTPQSKLEEYTEWATVLKLCDDINPADIKVAKNDRLLQEKILHNEVSYRFNLENAIMIYNMASTSIGIWK